MIRKRRRKKRTKQAKKQMRRTEITNQAKQLKCCRDKRKRAMENDKKKEPERETERDK